ncbi:MAG: DedA family protein [Planctomycetota bacterium]|jgi:membrane protein DedA with SNARE-associated domain|nr:DedA family protein [Planctomycetota bacterium]
MREWLKSAAAAAVEFVATWTTVFCVWLAETILVLGYPGIVILMAIESSFIPFPSELVMPPAGYLIHEGRMTWFGVVASGLLGSMLGAWANYYLAMWFGRRFFLKYGRYFLVKPEAIEKAETFFAEHGEITIFAGRLIPVIRQLISLPAGMARMPMGKFVLYTLLGAGIWMTALTWIGWMVGRSQDLLQEHLRLAVLWAALGAAAVVYLYAKWYGRKKKRAAGASAGAGENESA